MVFENTRDCTICCEKLNRAIRLMLVRFQGRDTGRPDSWMDDIAAEAQPLLLMVPLDICLANLPGLNHNCCSNNIYIYIRR